MVLETEKARRGLITWESEKGLDTCECNTRPSIGQWLLALCVCLLGFANFRHVSADSDDFMNVEPSHRALAGGGSISSQLQTDLDTLLNWKEEWLLYPEQNPNVTLFLQGWNGTSPCAWPGITCAPSGPAGTTRVTKIAVAGIGITGPMPQDGYANLSAVFAIDLSINQMNGTIPSAIADMASLQYLDLTLNLLVGDIPPEFEGTFMDQLVSLNVSANSMSGPILPTLFTACSSLQYLNLSANSFYGDVPSVGQCTSLELLDCWKNNFTGSIPSDLGLLPSLKEVVLSENFLDGPIPPGFLANCGSFVEIQLGRNSLTGPIPSLFSTCLNMEILNIQDNYLSGSIPGSLGQLSRLSLLALGNNTLGGPLPPELSALTNLQFADFSKNQFSGNIPASYSNLNNLVDLALQENELVGTFPIEVTNFINLRLLDLSHNQFSGVIPSQVGLLTNLTSLLLAFNNFSGVIPAEIGSLSYLQVLDLSSNSLTGSIPSQLGNLNSLLWLMLFNNQLSGPIPPELGNCSSLVWLNLAQNQLSGTIPDSFDTIGESAITTFLYNRNNLPLIQAEMGECGALERWIPGNYEPFAFLLDDLTQQGFICRTQWNLILKGQLHPADLDTPLAYMQLSYNSLSGPIPRSIGSGGKFSVLFLYHNQLTGSIPDTLDQIPLFNLNVSSNMLNGSIPASLGSSEHLLSMDLSFNNLSGSVPAALENLTFMDKFNVSYNNLSGPVPLDNQFATYSMTAYIGNPFLCSNGNPYASVSTDDSNILQQCGAMNSHSPGSAGRSSKKGASPKLILAITLGCAASVLFAAGCICLAMSRGAKHPASINRANAATDSRFKKVGRDPFDSARDLLKIPVSAFEPDILPKALAYVDLLVATNNFDDSNILGDGGFGVVYKAKLSDGSVVAIKKLNQDGAQGEREFASEMLTLGNIRHENLVPLLGYCSSEREKLLVYKCMTNGSLDQWLHDRSGGKEVLTWERRANIAAGAARGLAFLHHSCSPVIIHRDMKASNILLDDNYCARVTDFGLARRMYGQDTHVSTIVAGTLGYVPPEYSQTWRSTTRGDVYSFGVVLLELVTGRRPTGAQFDEKDPQGGHLGGNVVEWVRILLSKRMHEDAYDPLIKDQGSSQELLQFLKLAVVCTEEHGNNRPVMSDVSKALDQITLSINMRSPSQAFL